jgi:hypothetical protein
MSTPIIFPTRDFQMWRYTVGHSQLLLRSPKSTDFPTRIDVLFKGVEEFHLPTDFVGLEISETRHSDLNKLSMFRISPSGKKRAKVFTVRGKDYLGYVSALRVAVHEDEGEYDDPSFFSKNNIL